MKCPTCNKLLDLWNSNKDLYYCYKCRIIYHLDTFTISIIKDFTTYYPEYYPQEDDIHDKLGGQENEK
jgi:hypothetical protein